MKKIKSSVTFKDIGEHVAYIQVFWNGVLVYDDIEGEATPEELENFKLKYNEKTIYEIHMKVEGFHHFILEVKGE